MIKLFNLIVAGLVTAAGVSSLSAGLAWLLFGVSGLIFLIMNKIVAHQEPVVIPEAAVRAGLWWLLTCVLAFMLMAIPTAYWGGPWSERHPQLRLLIGAAGAWLLMKYVHLTILNIIRIANATALTLLLVFIWVVFRGAYSGPTNPIPWMAGISILACTLLALSYQLNFASVAERRFWWLVSALTLVTVLLSGVRGSWGLIFVWIFSWISFHRRDRSLFKLNGGLIVVAFLVVIAIFVFGNKYVSEDFRPLNRIILMWKELGISESSLGMQGAGSVGLRIGIYKGGIEQVTSSPKLLGIGHSEHKRLLQLHVQKVAPHVLGGIGHYHNDGLNAWSEFGLFGLLGYVCLPLGMIIIAWRAWCENNHAFATGLISIALQHVGTGLTNANFAHNYYPTLLSISLAILFLANYYRAHFDALYNN